MQGKTAYVRSKVFGPFPDPVQAGATCTGLPFLKKRLCESMNFRLNVSLTERIIISDVFSHFLCSCCIFIKICGVTSYLFIETNFIP
jgi:hypothetical protein